MRPSRVHILGGSGSGTTTLGHALAAHWAVPHADADDYFWMPTTPPFTRKRGDAERVALMREIFVGRPAWVLSGSMLGWGESVVAECDAIVFVALDPAERLRRLEAREVVRRGGLPHDDDAWRRRAKRSIVFCTTICTRVTRPSTRSSVEPWGCRASKASTVAASSTPS